MITTSWKEAESPSKLVERRGPRCEEVLCVRPWRALAPAASRRACSSTPATSVLLSSGYLGDRLSRRIARVGTRFFLSVRLRLEAWGHAMNQTNENMVSEGPDIRGHSISHIDALSILQIDGAAIAFTPTEYTLVMLLLHQLEKLQKTTNELIEIFVPFEDLQRSAALSTRSLLSKHIYNASAKLWTAGLSIARVDGYGYVIVFDIEGDTSRFLRQATPRQHKREAREEHQLYAIA